MMHRPWKVSDLDVACDRAFNEHHPNICRLNQVASDSCDVLATGHPGQSIQRYGEDVAATHLSDYGYVRVLTPTSTSN